MKFILRSVNYAQLIDNLYCTTILIGADFGGTFMKEDNSYTDNNYKIYGTASDKGYRLILDKVL